jgi:hypothetical protein
MDELRQSISPAAFDAIATLSDQALIKGERHASTSFDLKKKCKYCSVVMSSEAMSSV